VLVFCLSRGRFSSATTASARSRSPRPMWHPLRPCRKGWCAKRDCSLAPVTWFDCSTSVIASNHLPRLAIISGCIKNNIKPTTTHTKYLPARHRCQAGAGRDLWCRISSLLSDLFSNSVGCEKRAVPGADLVIVTTPVSCMVKSEMPLRLSTLGHC
jgi:hypothetical protein